MDLEQTEGRRSLLIEYIYTRVPYLINVRMPFRGREVICGAKNELWYVPIAYMRTYVPT